MKIDNFIPNEQAVPMVVSHPITGADTDAILYLLSPYHALFQQRKKAIARDAVLQSMIHTDQQMDLELRLTAAAISDWCNIEQDGIALSYSAENAEKLLLKAPWLRDQIVFFYTDAKPFFKTLSKE
jgi:hypothetical protein